MDVSDVSSVSEEYVAEVESGKESESDEGDDLLMPPDPSGSYNA